MADHLENRNKSEVKRRAGIGEWANGVIRIALVLLLGSSIAVGTLPWLWAQTSSSDSLATFRSGQVTDIRGNTIQIDKQEYTLDPNVVIKDDEGRPRGLKDIDPGAEVRFHLKHGRVDQLVLVLPK